MVTRVRGNYIDRVAVRGTERRGGDRVELTAGWRPRGIGRWSTRANSVLEREHFQEYVSPNTSPVSLQVTRRIPPLYNRRPKLFFSAQGIFHLPTDQVGIDDDEKSGSLIPVP